MGCFAGKQLTRQPSNYGHSECPPIEFITPDPDLGWRRLPDGMAFSSGGVAEAPPTSVDPREWTSNCAAEGHRGHSERGRGRQDSHPEILYPETNGWIVHFYNDRSGHCCKVMLVTLALNVAIRAERLAQAFGVVAAEGGNSTLTSSRTVSSSNVMRADSLMSDTRKIYRHLKIPDYGWLLLNRRIGGLTVSEKLAAAESHVLGADASKRLGQLQKRRSCPRHCKPSLSSMAPQLSDADAAADMQMLQRVGAQNAQCVLADVCSIGMNIAEQLYRLEKKQNKKHVLPIDTFDWEVMGPEYTNGFSVAVRSPEGGAFWLVPEEAILNIAQWVQQTYLTAAQF